MADMLRLKDAKHLALPVAGATGGVLAGKLVPSFIGFSEPSWARTGSQAALGIGALALDKKNKALQFAGIALLGVALVELLGRYVLPAGYVGANDEYPSYAYGAYPEDSEPALEAGEVEAYPFQEFQEFGAETDDRYTAGVTY